MEKKSFNQLKAEEALRKDASMIGEMHEEPAMANLMAQAKRRPEPKAVSDQQASQMSPPQLKAAMLKEKIKDIRQEIASATEEKREDEKCEKCGDAGHDVAKCWMGKSLRAQAEMAKSEDESLGTVPHSELAMHTKIAGKKIAKYNIKNPHIAEVYVEGDHRPVSGTHGEVLSPEIKQKHGLK